MILAAGDIADCSDEGDGHTAALLDGLDGTVVALGDLAYDDGTPEEFAECYDPTWGQYKARTLPVLGNHEYETEGAEGYFGYFGAAAGDPGKGYHSLDLGAWHVVVLNSNCEDAGGCDEESPQGTWLRDDLQASDARCTLALWHHPRFSSGEHGSYDSTGPLWEVLYDEGAELVLNGHDHNYERFAPQTPSGEEDPDHGIVEIVVGTGGNDLRDMNSPIANSLVQNSDSHGVLEVTLADDGARWQFVPVPGDSLEDSGSLTCHDRP